jgi:hypothetical protein
MAIPEVIYSILVVNMAKKLEPAATLQAYQRPRSIEEMPYEILNLILSQAPNLNTLQAFVHASPRLHSVYFRERRRILGAVVGQSFDGFLVDAHAAYLSRRNKFLESPSDSMLSKLLEAYPHGFEATATRPNLAAELLLEDLVQMARFHRSVIEPLTDRFLTFAAPHIPNKNKESIIRRKGAQRTLYRFDVFSNVCRSREGWRGQTNRALRQGSRDRPLDLLRVLFPASEVEDVRCVNTSTIRFSVVHDVVARQVKIRLFRGGLRRELVPPSSSVEYSKSKLRTARNQLGARAS